jgi:hypothetical protein
MHKEYFEIARIYTDNQGETHFEDLLIDMKQADSKPHESILFDTQGIIFRKAASNQKRTWHQAPEKQIIVSISGSATITVSDGEARVFNPGSLLIVEDTEEHSKGHTTIANKEAGERKTIFIPMNTEQFKK